MVGIVKKVYWAGIMTFNQTFNPLTKNNNFQKSLLELV